MIHHKPALMIGDPGYLEPVGDENEEDTCTSGGLDSYLCTRPFEHEGAHAAHNNNDEQIASWDANNS